MRTELAPNAPIRPGEADTTAAGRPAKTFWSCGAEPTSIAFFSGAGTDRLYSGVTKSMASAA